MKTELLQNQIIVPFGVLLFLILCPIRPCLRPPPNANTDPSVSLPQTSFSFSHQFFYPS